MAALILATLLSSSAVNASGSGSPILCGVATNQFGSTRATLAAAVNTGKLSFWWNWGTAPKIDLAGIPASVAAATNKTFIPMLWGQAPPDDYSFLSSSAEGHLMGYNEPDLYGPACCNCDQKQSYFPATSSGGCRSSIR